MAGGLAGLLAGAAGLAVAEAVSALLEGTTSPLLAVANRAVDSAPRPVKEWAIETFGSADKPVLIGGVVVTVAALAFLAGAVGVTRRRTALVLLAALSAVAAAAVLTDRAASAPVLVRLLPVAALVIVSTATLLLMLRTLRVVPSTRSGGSAPSTPSTPIAFDRRAFLRSALAVGAVAAAGGAVSRVYGTGAAAASRLAVGVPVPDLAAPPLGRAMTLDVPGITPYLTSNRDFYRVDTALRVPDVPVDQWRLRVHGLVDRELDLSFDDLLSRRLVERRITLTCVSNPVGGEYAGNATWIGVPVRDLLREAGVREGADAVRSRSADDFTAGTPLSAVLDDGRDALLAVAMNGEPLPLEHGFPVRMVTPGLYGYVSATKWLVDLEVTRFADFEAYWTSRGYAAQAPIKTSSRIDVPRSFARVKAGRVPVAGVAWSQDRGIRYVDVRVDGGPWQRARLADEDNVDTWRQWVWEWDATPGSHLLEVRATDASGYTQTADRAPIAPDGSTGWHNVNVTVEG
ncbi:MAG TPA: molybdopterin-dependent oxidoreductase [Nocardioidaceae bacterium]|nr:molybdopterin-dependent oxidoreductase [Nocardioidaceae bacterium]